MEIEVLRAKEVARVASRLGLNVPRESWPAPPLLKSIEAGEFRWVQVHAPPARVLSDPRARTRHARGVRYALDETALKAIVHAPDALLAGTPEADAALAGAIEYAGAIEARYLVYHARNLPADWPSQQDRALAETHSLAGLAGRAERLGVTIALENLAPVYLDSGRLSDDPAALVELARRIGSPAIGLCLDIGHAQIVADLHGIELNELIEPALPHVELFHLHDNLGGRLELELWPEFDPLKLDLHLVPGNGRVPWQRIARALREHHAPLLLEVKPPHRKPPVRMREIVLRLLDSAPSGLKGRLAHPARDQHEDRSGERQPVPDERRVAGPAHVGE